jgi:hypothetical protein
MANCATTPKKLLLRRDTDINWTRSNPLLGSGEPGFEYNTGKLKVGDGVTYWRQLPYIGGNTSGIIDSFDGGTPSSVYGTTPGIIDAGGVL